MKEETILHNQFYATRREWRDHDHKAEARIR